MDLSAQQVAQFERDGYLIFPELFSKAEVAVLRAETARLSTVEADSVIRERMRQQIKVLAQTLARSRNGDRPHF